MTVSASKFVTTVSWTQAKTNTGFTDTKQGPASKSFSVSPTAATYNEIQLERYTIGAGNTREVDLYSFTNKLYQSVTATKVLGIFLKATGNTGQLKIEPSASNPVTWFFGGTTPSITLDCGANGCLFAVCDGDTHTVNATQRGIKLSNPGSATITVDMVVLEGT